MVKDSIGGKQNHPSLACPVALDNPGISMDVLVQWEAKSSLTGMSSGPGQSWDIYGCSSAVGSKIIPHWRGPVALDNPGISMDVLVQWFPNFSRLAPPWLPGGFLAPPSYTHANTHFFCFFGVLQIENNKINHKDVFHK